MKRNIRFNTTIFLSLVVLMTFACKKKENAVESQSFTEESHDYTSDESASKIDHIKFTDVTSEAGIDFKHVTGAFGKKWMPETIGSGGGFLDYNNDGFVHIF